MPPIKQTVLCFALTAETAFKALNQKKKDGLAKAVLFFFRKL